MDLLRRLIYLPGGRVPPPASVAPDVEEVVLATRDGLRLDAWFLSAGPATPGVLLLHGNGGTRAGRLPLARALAQRGISTLLVDYRGYGGNPGRPHERGLLADARAGLAHLRVRDDVGAVVAFGESLGAAVAVALAAEGALAADEPLAALVLRSPFTSLEEVAAVHYPLPGPLLATLLPDRYPARELIGDVDAPVLVIAGEADTIVPFEHSRRLFEAAHEPKRFVAIPAADHNDDALLAGRRLIDAVVAFLTDHGVR